MSGEVLTFNLMTRMNSRTKFDSLVTIRDLVGVHFNFKDNAICIPDEQAVFDFLVGVASCIEA